MKQKRFLRRRLYWYLVLLLIGMGGVIFSDQLTNPGLRFAVVLLSVAIPIFAGGNFLARYGSQGIEKLVLLAGVLMLLVGAAFSFSNASVYLQDEFVKTDISAIARWLGIMSLMLGLLAVMFSVVRTGRAIDEIGERFRQVADHISEGFVLSSPDGTINLVNQQFLDMFDLNEEDLVGESAFELIAKWRADEIAPHLDLRGKGLASEYEIGRTVRGVERQFWMSGTPIFDRHGQHMGTLATVRDVTEKNRMAKRLEQYAKGLQDQIEERTQKLRHSEEQLRDLLMHMNEGFLTIDASHKIRFANNRICELLLTTPDVIRGREVFDFIDPPGRIRLMELLHAEGAGYETGLLRPELTFIAQDGAMVPVVVAVSRVRESADTDIRYSLVITNVSELKLMQRQLESRANELETANEELRMYGRAKDSFLSNVSHELKTPLSTIQGYVEMLEAGSLGQMQTAQLNALTVIGRNLKRLVSLINEMIEFSRMEIRGVQLNITLFNAGKLIREAIASVQPHAMSKDLSINMYVADDFSPVWGDREKISQVLGILLSNAVKFSHTGGLILIRVSETPSHTLAIAVTDTGIGIDPAHQNRVFDKFYQVDGSISRRYEGAGIGLSIAKSVVEAHGGVIELESEINKGSTFTIVLPKAIFDEAVPPARLQGMKHLSALVCIEKDVFRAAVRRVLAQGGCMIEEANNVFECARIAEEIEPDVILMDDAVAAGSGAAVITGLRENTATTSVPISIFNNRATPKIQELSESCPHVYRLAKPFSARDLIDHVRLICFNETSASVRNVEGTRMESSVLVFEPDRDLLEWVDASLRRRKIASYGAASMEESIALARRHGPDVVFVDVDGLADSQQRLAEFRDLPEMRDKPLYILSGLSPLQQAAIKGVDGILSKPFSIDQMTQLVYQSRMTARQAPLAR